MNGLTSNDAVLFSFVLLGLHQLPRAVLQRLIKNVVPDGVGISRDAKIAFGVAAQIFVSYVTATANDIALAGKRKTLTVHILLVLFVICARNSIVSCSKVMVSNAHVGKGCVRSHGSHEFPRFC